MRLGFWLYSIFGAFAVWQREEYVVAWDWRNQGVIETTDHKMSHWAAFVIANWGNRKFPDTWHWVEKAKQ